MLRKRVLRDIRYTGQTKAQDLYEPELRKQGYDAFWSDPMDVYGNIFKSP